MIRVVGWKQLSEENSPLLPVALTIGTFDSLHAGHQRLIRGVVENGYGAVAAVCTFEQNPASVLGSRPLVGSILSFPQKIDKLEGLGVALVVLIDFSPEISKLTGKSFWELLSSRLDVKKLVVGYNFHMGQGRDTHRAGNRSGDHVPGRGRQQLADQDFDPAGAPCRSKGHAEG